SVAVVDKTNMKKPPDFVSPGYPDFNYYVSAESVCKGAGEKGKDIGLITEEVINSLKYDRDGDGIPDEVDQCPDVPEDVDGFEDDDGCPDFDNDGDGIYDVDDKCPDEPEDFDGFEDDDGCPDPDNDMDGIVDEEDACPNQPETVNGYKDNDGCPDEKPEVIRESLVLEGVHFKPASAELLEESYYALEKVFNSLEAYPHVRVEITGHTDSKGPDNYNKILSKQRAEAVKKYLELRGIDEARMKAVGYGEEQPIADNKTAEGRKKNRRVEIKPLN
ncbi:MAG: OmpA family protein, partial [Chitinivibrionales bacterium]